MRSRRVALASLLAGTAGIAWPSLGLRAAAGAAPGAAAGATREAAESASPTRPPPGIVASFSILADMVKNVAGPDAEVTSLVPANADAHVFEPTPTDARRVAAAGLVVVNGLGFEGWLERLLRAADGSARIVVASAGVPTRRLGAGTDPHAWQDLGNARVYVANIRDALIAAQPGERQAIERRAAGYTARLDAEDAAIKALFAAIPRGERRVVTSHDAFGYFGAAYGVDFMAPQGISTTSEPSAAALARLVDQIRNRQVRGVFIENISDPRLVERAAEEGGATVGGTLYSDALSPPGTEADTYLKLMSHNAATIAAALRGERAVRR